MIQGCCSSAEVFLQQLPLYSALFAVFQGDLYLSTKRLGCLCGLLLSHDSGTCLEISVLVRGTSHLLFPTPSITGCCTLRWYNSPGEIAVSALSSCLPRHVIPVNFKYFTSPSTSDAWMCSSTSLFSRQISSNSYPKVIGCFVLESQLTFLNLSIRNLYTRGNDKRLINSRHAHNLIQVSCS